MQEFINNPDWGKEDKEWAENGLAILNESIGEFVNIDTPTTDILTLDTVFPFPCHINILIDRGNGSTAEQFLLDAKQSAKVKLFGETTHGVLDISNMHFVDFPCGEYRLGYGLSKSLRIPHIAIDGIGLQPDFYIPKEIPKYEWVEFIISLFP